MVKRLLLLSLMVLVLCGASAVVSFAGGPGGTWRRAGLYAATSNDPASVWAGPDQVFNGQGGYHPYTCSIEES